MQTYAHMAEQTTCCQAGCGPAAGPHFAGCHYCSSRRIQCVTATQLPSFTRALSAVRCISRSSWDGSASNLARQAAKPPGGRQPVGREGWGERFAGEGVQGCRSGIRPESNRHAVQAIT